MDDPPSTLTLLAIAALVALNAFLVAAEFALIAVRRVRIEQHVRLSGARVFPTLERLEQLVFAAQVARSAASVQLGYLAFLAGRQYLLPLLGPGRPLSLAGIGFGTTDAAATVLAVLLVALVHATLGQQAPKLVAIHRAEWITAHVALPVLEALALVLRPVTWPLNAVVRGAVRLAGVRDAGFHPLMQTAEEIRLLVARRTDEDEIEEEEREMIRGVIEISETVAREVMTPRTAMVAVPVDVSFAELVRVAVEEGHSRLPVYDGSIDSIVGVVLAKDLLPLVRDHGAEWAGFDLATVMRPAYFVPDTKPVNELLTELRRQAVHLAIVLDEFGGTYGLVTMEDLLEEIVGEIRDEYDAPEGEMAEQANGDFVIEGAASLADVNDRFGLTLPEEEFDTLGGYVFGTLGRVPVVGDVVAAPARDGARELRVEATEERRVTLVRLLRPADPADAAAHEPLAAAEEPAAG